MKSNFSYTIQDLEKLTALNRGELRRMMINHGVISSKSGLQGGCRIVVLTHELRLKWPEFLAAIMDRQRFDDWNVKDKDTQSRPRQMSMFFWSLGDLSAIAGCDRHKLRRLLIAQGLITPDNGRKKIRISMSDMVRECPKLFWALKKYEEQKKY